MILPSAFLGDKNSEKMPRVLWALCFGVLETVLCSFSEDHCSWRGVACPRNQKAWSRSLYTVLKAHLSGCTQLEPYASASPPPPHEHCSQRKSPRQITTCIKPSSTFQGAQIYLERDGILELLLSETDASLRPRVRCFSWLPQEKVALFLQSTLHQDISRRIAAFRYELRGDWNSRLSLPSSNLSLEGACRPCNDTEILMAICTSDFVIRGNIRTVSNDVERQESIISVSATRVHRQKFTLFQPVSKSSKSMGSIHTLLRCGVKPGPGSFLFMGWLHFGEAWLSCAPRYKDFQRIYEIAHQAHENPCEVSLD